MIRVIPSSERFRYEGDWLTTYWHFSFSHYYDPANLHWGALRVFNDDVVQPSSGFPLHPHQNFEIVSYVISGELTHEDSLGHKGRIRPGEVQRMTAGSGIVHAEYNESATEPVHFLQMWVVPGQKNLTPGWEQRQFTPEERLGRLLPVVSGETGKGAAIQMNQDATFYISSLAAGDKVEHQLRPGRHAYLFVIDGEVSLNGQTLRKGDQARIREEASLSIAAAAPTELVLWDTP